MPPSDAIQDLVVVLPGIMGSTLAKNGKPVWSPSAGSVLTAIRTFGKSIRELTLPKDIGDDHPGDKVTAEGLMPDIHVLPGIWSANIGYGVLMDWLRSRFHCIEPSSDDPSRIPNLLPVPYDWRLSNRYNGRQLKKTVEPALERWRAQGGPFADARIIFVCHSMGGLVARWYIEKEGGAAITRKLVTMGTPYRGALNALDQLVNGVRKGIGPLKIDLSGFARSLPALYQLLPEYACIESPGGLLKTTQISAPELDPKMVSDAMKFHDDLDEAADKNTGHAYDVHPILGFRQPTFATAKIAGDGVEPVATINGNDEGGDATVPRFAATPKNMTPTSPAIHFVPDQHGSLQSNQAILDQLEGILTSRPVVYRAASQYQLGVSIEPIVLAGEPMPVEATVAGGARVGLVARVNDERGNEVAASSLTRSGGVYRVSLDALPPGAYCVTVGGVEQNSSQVAPVTATVLVW